MVKSSFYIVAFLGLAVASCGTSDRSSSTSAGEEPKSITGSTTYKASWIYASGTIVLNEDGTGTREVAKPETPTTNDGGIVFGKKDITWSVNIKGELILTEKHGQLKGQFLENKDLIVGDLSPFGYLRKVGTKPFIPAAGALVGVSFTAPKLLEHFRQVRIVFSANQKYAWADIKTGKESERGIWTVEGETTVLKCQERWMPFVTRYEKCTDTTSFEVLSDKKSLVVQGDTRVWTLE